MRYNPDTHMPVSDATTLYDLWDDICQAVIDEPKRLFMGVWFTQREDAMDEYNLKPPFCGTVCCWAGWAVMARGEEYAIYEFERRGKLLLCGYSPSDMDSEEFGIWSSLRADVSAFFYYEPPHAVTNQTPEYVDIVVARAREIMTRYEPYLKSHSVPPKGVI